MATRSAIGMVQENGAVRSIYCHFYGYPEYNGKLLKEFYTDESKIKELLDLGDLSVLGSDIGEKQDFKNPTSEDWCLAYGRDRDEIHKTEAVLYGSRKQFYDEAVSDYCADYVYMFDKGEWICWDCTGQKCNL